MNAHVTDQPALPFNRDMLRWAREQREISLEEAAKRAGVQPDAVAAWEKKGGDSAPTVRQARKLSELYQRSFLEFFRETPPPARETALVPDFRLHRGAAKPREALELKDIQAWAEEMRLNALDLYEVLGEDPPSIPDGIRARAGDDPEAVAATVRDVLSFDVEEQVRLRQRERDALPKLLRRKIEAASILVLKENGLAQFGARGLCMAVDPLPIIMFSAEAASAQMFTLAHEMGHVCLGESAISGPPVDARRHSHEGEVERWCNQFAAAFLVPRMALAEMFPPPPRPAPRIEDASLESLARTFGVSAHAMILRLVDLRYVAAEFYWNEKRAQLLAREAAYKGGGRSLYYGSRYRSARGDLYTGLVLEAWGAQRITNHNAAEFMGIKNFRHLDDIRNHFGDE